VGERGENKKSMRMNHAGYKDKGGPGRGGEGKGKKEEGENPCTLSTRWKGGGGEWHPYLSQQQKKTTKKRDTNLTGEDGFPHPVTSRGRGKKKHREREREKPYGPDVPCNKEGKKE